MAQTAQTDVILPTEPARELPVVRSIGVTDLRDALAKGVDDFRAMPTHVLFLSLIYPMIGLGLGAATFGYDLIPLLYPLAAGFALIGPLAAIGLYELSRRRELGLDTSWQHAFDVRHSPSLRSIAALGACCSPSSASGWPSPTPSTPPISVSTSRWRWASSSARC